MHAALKWLRYTLLAQLLPYTTSRCRHNKYDRRQEMCAVSLHSGAGEALGVCINDTARTRRALYDALVVALSRRGRVCSWLVQPVISFSINLR